jgi:hypothetical protein
MKNKHKEERDKLNAKIKEQQDKIEELQQEMVLYEEKNTKL